LTLREFEDRIIEITTEDPSTNKKPWRIANGVKLETVPPPQIRLEKEVVAYIAGLKEAGLKIDNAEKDPAKFARALQEGGIVEAIEERAKQRAIAFEEWGKRWEMDKDWDQQYSSVIEEEWDYGEEEANDADAWEELQAEQDEWERQEQETPDENGDMGIDISSKDD